MKTYKHIIKDPVGMHARPASKLVQELTKFKSKVEILLGDKKANAKSIINLMALGIKSGNEIIFNIEGDDEEKLFVSLPNILETLQI